MEVRELALGEKLGNEAMVGAVEPEDDDAPLDLLGGDRDVGGQEEKAECNQGGVAGIHPFSRHTAF